MSYTKIGRNKVYASIEDLPENLKLVDGDRILIQTDNGTALVDWENITISKDKTDFKEELEEFTNFVLSTESYVSMFNENLRVLSKGVEELSNELLGNTDEYLPTDATEGLSAEELPASNTQPQFKRIKDIITRLEQLEGNDNEIGHPQETDKDGKLIKSTPRIDNIEARFTSIEDGTKHLKYEEPIEGEDGTINSKIKKLLNGEYDYVEESDDSKSKTSISLFSKIKEMSADIKSIKESITAIEGRVGQLEAKVTIKE